MSGLHQRVFCPVCGAVRVCQRRSAFAVCPNGHGRLVRRFTQAEARRAFTASLPLARRVGRGTFRIGGHEGLFRYRGGSGRRPARAGQPLAADELIARHVTRSRQLIRVFARKPPKRKTRRPQDGTS
jgi:hypothetical protein